MVEKTEEQKIAEREEAQRKAEARARDDRDLFRAQQAAGGPQTDGPKHLGEIRRVQTGQIEHLKKTADRSELDRKFDGGTKHMGIGIYADRQELIDGYLKGSKTEQDVAAMLDKEKGNLSSIHEQAAADEATKHILSVLKYAKEKKLEVHCLAPRASKDDPSIIKEREALKPVHDAFLKEKGISPVDKPNEAALAGYGEFKKDYIEKHPELKPAIEKAEQAIEADEKRDRQKIAEAAVKRFGSEKIAFVGTHGETQGLIAGLQKNLPPEKSESKDKPTEAPLGAEEKARAAAQGVKDASRAQGVHQTGPDAGERPTDGKAAAAGTNRKIAGR